MSEKIIYKIVNKVNGKKYIGSTIEKTKRWRQHKRNLRGGYHTNIYLQNAWNKYGGDSFVFNVVEEVNETSDLVQREQYYMDTLEPAYNIKPKADRSEMSKETKYKIIEANKGREHSRETRQKMSETHKGKEISQETREKISESLSGKNHPNFGKEIPEETKEKISKSNKGKEMSEEARIKMSESHKDEELSDEHKRKMSEAQKGKKNGNSKLTDKKVKIIKHLLNGDSFTHKQIGAMFGVARGTIGNISVGRNWSHVEI